MNELLCSDGPSNEEKQRRQEKNDSRRLSDDCVKLKCAVPRVCNACAAETNLFVLRVSLRSEILAVTQGCECVSHREA